MLYLITTRGASILNEASDEIIAKGLALLKQGVSSGKIKAAYSLVAGGSIWIVDAASHADVARALHKFHIGSAHDVTVEPILDTEQLLTNFSAERSKVIAEHLKLHPK